MAKLNIIYASTTGNTEQMAAYMEQEAIQLGIDSEMFPVDIVGEEVLNAEYLAFGSSAAGAEEILSEMTYFLETSKEQLEGRTVGLFGSYDWGGGEFMNLWKELMEFYGVQVVGDGLIVHLTPDDEEKINLCREYVQNIINNTKI